MEVEFLTSLLVAIWLYAAARNESVTEPYSLYHCKLILKTPTSILAD